MALLDKIKKLFGKKTPKRNKDTGSALERYYKSFLHAIDGIIYATKYEHNIIIIICATIFAISCGLIFNLSTYEWLFIIFICFLLHLLNLPFSFYFNMNSFFIILIIFIFGFLFYLQE